MKKWLLLVAAFMSTLIACAAYADNLKIGVVDMNQVLQRSPLMVSLNDNLTKKFKPRQDQLNTANQQLQDEGVQLDTTGGSLSAADRSKLQNKILADKANVQILNATFQRDLAIAKDQDLQTFMAKLTSVITKIAQDGHYDLIQQQTNMLYVNSTVDITQAVLKQLG